jgi:hypothetical protein
VNAAAELASIADASEANAGLRKAVTTIDERLGQAGDRCTQ